MFDKAKEILKRNSINTESEFKLAIIRHRLTIIKSLLGTIHGEEIIAEIIDNTIEDLK